MINLQSTNSVLPLDVVLMAGGQGSRLRPLTDSKPKPLLEILDKPILEYQLDSLTSFGISDYWISVHYLGDQIENYFRNHVGDNINIEFVWEDQPMGSIGAVSRIKNFRHADLLIVNSDILSDLDYSKFYASFIESEADMAVVTVPYRVDLPFAVLELESNQITGFSEKPSYSYQVSGGIYLIKRDVTQEIPENRFYDATDLMEALLTRGKNIVSYKHSGYWLDVGRPEDFQKAKNDIGNIFSETR